MFHMCYLSFFCAKIMVRFAIFLVLVIVATILPSNSDCLHYVPHIISENPETGGFTFNFVPIEDNGKVIMYCQNIGKRIFK